MNGLFNAKAKGLGLKSTPRKVALVAALIRGKKASSAVAILKFCPKKAACEVDKVLKSALFNAQNNYGVDIDSLFVKEVLIGRSKASLYRMSPRARGKSYKISKLKVNLVVKLSKEG